MYNLNPIKLSEFYQNLPIEYQSLLAEYYKLSSSSLILEKDLERMTKIWNKAQKDEVFTTCLEMIDWVCGFPDKDNDKEMDIEYLLNEYLEILISKKIDEKTKKYETEKNMRLNHVPVVDKDDRRNYRNKRTLTFIFTVFV